MHIRTLSLSLSFSSAKSERERWGGSESQEAGNVDPTCRPHAIPCRRKAREENCHCQYLEASGDIWAGPTQQMGKRNSERCRDLIFPFPGDVINGDSIAESHLKPQPAHTYNRNMRARPDLGSRRRRAARNSLDHPIYISIYLISSPPADRASRRRMVPCC
ncbi:hypothetical protein LZ31DRAFT_117539 [Colletotrichum somersetense]|nr:hypothetical protein LZ31DRAFT_117539 [Colletotrichum somersetense]